MFIYMPRLTPRRIVAWLTYVGLPYWTSCYSSRPIPITVLSGFLGSGKTTLLQNLLSNEDGLRIAVIVNDVASVNIDSKLVASENQAAGMVELQNGCACCSQAEELLASVAELVTLSDLRADDDAFDHIVIECSGVADPKGIRAQFQQAALYQMPLMERVQLDTMVTVIDSASYLEYLESDRIASPDETPELYYPGGNVPEAEDASWEGDENIPPALRALLGQGNDQPPSTEESVAALLISQTETADVILLNKVDLATPERVKGIEAVVRACCPIGTRIQQCTYAKVDWQEILAVADGQGVVMSGVVDDHREAVRNASPFMTVSEEEDDVACRDPDCTETHAHSHDHSTPTAEKGTHNHEHSHDHSPGDTTDTHSHSHDHGCDDPNCTDPTHSHQGASSHAGIATFVYKARRPFHPGRLTAFLRKLPIRMGLPSMNEESISSDNRDHDDDDDDDDDDDLVLSQILRSKGFCWCADSHRIAYYWSQAGPSFELAKVGAWWATLPREQWPPSAVKSILADFDDEAHDESTVRGGRSVGDRRQEVVLIGTSLGNRKNRAWVEKCLDECLLRGDEWDEYCKNCSNEEVLRSKFPTPLISRMMSY